MIVGVDYDSYGIYLVRIPWARGPVETETLPLRKKTETGRAHEWRALSRVALRVPLSRLLTDAETALVYVERGFGASRSSDWTLGSIYGAIVAAVNLAGRSPNGDPPVVNSIDLQEWKKAVAGSGNAKKDAAHAALFAIAEEEGWQIADFSPDLRDALAIAYAGREANARAFS